MRKTEFFLMVMALVDLTGQAAVRVNTAPVVSQVTVVQRTDSSGIVDIYYTLDDADGDDCIISIEVSNDGGSSWNVLTCTFSGDIGSEISPGFHHINWDCKADLPEMYGTNYMVKVIADDGLATGSGESNNFTVNNTGADCPKADLNGNCFVSLADFALMASQWLTGEKYVADPTGMIWVTIDDPDVPVYKSFSGQMSKYETTNAQYCQFLNAALASGDITVGTNNIVYGANGSNSGADFTGERYFRTSAASSYSQITYSESVFSVRSRDGYDMSKHPVVEVSWYGATAFCNYYGYRLPTEWEWQAVADYNGSYFYGCGITINHSKANYEYDNPLGLSRQPYTTPAGYYPAKGYGMCDMAGNVWEWTSSLLDQHSSYRVQRGGGWSNDDYYCEVTFRHGLYPHVYGRYNGFRVCRSELKEFIFVFSHYETSNHFLSENFKGGYHDD